MDLKKGIPLKKMRRRREQRTNYWEHRSLTTVSVPPHFTKRHKEAGARYRIYSCFTSLKMKTILTHHLPSQSPYRFDTSRLVECACDRIRCLYLGAGHHSDPLAISFPVLLPPLTSFILDHAVLVIIFSFAIDYVDFMSRSSCPTRNR
jgi:hypothetical protein